MTVVIPPGFGQAAVELRNEFDPESWYVTFGIDLSDAAGDFFSAADAVGQCFETSWQDILSNQVTVVAVDLRVGQDGGPPLYVRAPRGNVGTSTAEKLPQNCAALVSKYTGRAGRRGRGRYYMPGVLNEGSVSQTGIIANAHLSDLNDRAVLMVSNMENGILGTVTPVPMVLLHGPGTLSETEPDAIQGTAVSALIATQRRRLR